MDDSGWLPRWQSTSAPIAVSSAATSSTAGAATSWTKRVMSDAEAKDMRWASR